MERKKDRVFFKDVAGTASTWFAAGLAILLITSCGDRRGELRQRWQENPSFHIGYWEKSWQAKPLGNRIAKAPAELVEKIRIENELEGFSENPEPAEPPAEFLLALESILKLLPPAPRAVLEERFIGIFAVRELGGSGYADVVFDGEGAERYGLIVLDVDALMARTANAWATWKLNSLFRPKSGSGPEIEAIIEEPGNDTGESSVRFILLHELGHVLGMLTRAQPSWIQWAVHQKADLDYPFVKLSWRLSGDNRIVSRFDDRFAARKSIRAYAFDQSEISREEIPGLFRALAEHTDFPTPFAAQDPWEDFAESFATYVHTVLDTRPFRIVAREDGRTETLLESCWEQGRCRAKREFLENWLGHR